MQKTHSTVNVQHLMCQQGDGRYQVHTTGLHLFAQTRLPTHHSVAPTHHPSYDVVMETQTVGTEP